MQITQALEVEAIEQRGILLLGDITQKEAVVVD
jgi:hypothetical protein